MAAVLMEAMIGGSRMIVLWEGLTYSGHPPVYATACDNLGSSIGHAAVAGRDR